MYNIESSPRNIFFLLGLAINKKFVKVKISVSMLNSYEHNGIFLIAKKICLTSIICHSIQTILIF